ncbi:hypothetical protein ES288_A11G337500v1 [Gossypium darwinii]|uniref:Uncharacterized protein n=1 Tax=Gossypium darwinii TaxID=34276 RepID=A0A5D2ERF7_GOSDA|nr:hypothetical protein ES288_A11G337500v1 [Gossypium darwinii]
MLGGRRRTNSDRILSLEAATLEIYSLLLRYLDSHRRRISLGGNQQAGVSFLVQRTGRAVPRAMFASRKHVAGRMEAQR